MHKQYRPDEFTTEFYGNLIERIKTKFTVMQYDEVSSASSNFILLRHDVDFSLERALRIAQIEHSKAVQSTFFVHLHNDFYHLLDVKSQDIIRSILALGHTIGLHFDPTYHGLGSGEALEYWLRVEKQVLETYFSTEVTTFSFHNPNAFSMQFENHEYVGMVNAYSTFFKEEVAYCSDSNGYWRYQSINEVLGDDEVTRLQFLTHPGWWTEEALLPRQKIQMYAEKRMINTLADYDRVMHDGQRTNIGLDECVG